MKQFLKKHAQLILLVIGMVFFRTAIADWHAVPSSSMEPTMYSGDVIWVNKLAFGPAIPFTKKRLFSTGSPERGDIITFYNPDASEHLLVKRVIAVPGDKVEIKGPNISINGEAVSLELIRNNDDVVQALESLPGKPHPIQYTHSIPADMQHYSFEVPGEQYFVMGDHRNNSHDSRIWGFVDETQVLSKATHIAVSFAKNRGWSDRIARPLDEG
jgi:signal peptidase I